MESVEEDHGISLGREVAILPRGKQRFQAADDSRDRALRQVPLAEQWFQRRPDAATIDAAEIAAEDRLVDLARPPRVPRQQLAVEFSHLAVTTSDPAARNRDRARALRRGEGPRDGAIPITAPLLGAFVAIGAERHRQ